jgi:hypothetical protein
MKAKVREVYSTASTKLFLDNDFEIVKEEVREITEVKAVQPVKIG